MGADAPQIAAIVVNFGTASLALEAVASLMAMPFNGDVPDIHLLDNASPEGDATVLAEAIAMRGWQDRVALHVAPENLGFGRGNNMVLHSLAKTERPPDFVFLLNPDARLGAPGLKPLLDCLLTHPRTAAAGASLRDADGQPTSSAFRFPSIAGEFAEMASFGPLTRLLDRWRIPLPAEQPSGRVDWVTGAAVLFRFEALREVGFFDPGYFLYYEEVDLMRRLADKGWCCRHVGEAVAEHVEGAATGLRGDEIGLRRRPAYWYRSRRLYFYRSHGRTGAIACALASILGAGFNQFQSRMRGRRPWCPERFIRDTWTHMLRPLLFGWTPRSAPEEHYASKNDPEAP